MSEQMRQHSETAWKIASLYSRVLASETRDLAAHIDVALAAERERCARLIESGAGMADLIDQELLDTQAAYIRENVSAASGQRPKESK